MRSYTVLILLVIIGVGCNSIQNEQGSGNEQNSKSQVADLKKEVIAVHDTAMARMGQMGQLQRELKNMMEKGDSVEILGVYTDLERARESMMDWMRNFKVSEDSTESAQAAYLEGEYDEIKKVDQHMRVAISRAERILSEEHSRGTNQKE